MSEIGLDGKSRVPPAIQQATLDVILALLAESPRLASLHSYEATSGVLAALERYRIKGAILHWWLGDERQTRRAVELGCFFSFNASSVRRTDLLDLIPLDRLLTETDHPFGDRRSGNSARPGLVTTAEQALARWHGMSSESLRRTVWANLANLVSQTGCVDLLPRAVRRYLAVS